MSVAPWTLSWPRKMLAPVPVLPTLPVARHRMQLARTLAVPTVCCVWPMHQISVAGFCVANRSEEHTSELQSLIRISYAVFCLQKNNEHDYTHALTLP